MMTKIFEFISSLFVMLLLIVAVIMFWMAVDDELFEAVQVLLEYLF